MAVKISVSLQSGNTDRRTVEAAQLPDGRTEYTLADGRKLIPPKTNQYVLHYASNWVGAKPGETYAIAVSLMPQGQVNPSFCEMWNHDIEAVRCYAYSKINRLECPTNGTVFSSDELKAHFSGT